MKTGWVIETAKAMEQWSGKFSAKPVLGGRECSFDDEVYAQLATGAADDPLKAWPMYEALCRYAQEKGIANYPKRLLEPLPGQPEGGFKFVGPDYTKVGIPLGTPTESPLLDRFRDKLAGV